MQIGPSGFLLFQTFCSNKCPADNAEPSRMLRGMFANPCTTIWSWLMKNPKNQPMYATIKKVNEHKSSRLKKDNYN